MHVHRSFRKYKFLLSLPRLISQKKSAHVQHLLTFRIDEAFMGNHSKCKLPCTYGGNRFSQQIFTRNTNFNLCNNRRDESSKWSSSGVQGSNKSIHQLQLQLAMQDCWRKTKGIFVSMHFVCGFSATVVHQVVDTPHSNSPVMPHIFSGAQQTIYVYIWHIAHLSSAAPKFPHAVRCKRENQQPHF